MRLDTTSTTSSGTTTRGPSRKRKRVDRNESAPATEARESVRGEWSMEAPANGAAEDTAGSAAPSRTNGTAANGTNGTAANGTNGTAANGTNGTAANGTRRAPARVRRRRATNGRARTLPDDGGRLRENGAALTPINGTAAAATEVADGRLTPDQLQLLEERLLDERARALRAIWVKRGDIEDHRETGSLDEVEMDIRMAERHSEFITLIDGALRRLRDSPEDFDVSEVSGARIPFERLEIVPWTRRLTEEMDPYPG